MPKAPPADKTAAAKAAADAAAPAPTPAAEVPAPPAPPPAPRRFRVKLHGVKVRYVDPETENVSFQDHLDLEATNEGEAWLKFKDFNGIRGTTQAPEISEIVEGI